MHKKQLSPLQHTIAIAASIPLAAFGAYTAVSHLRYHRSNTATASVVYNWITSNKRKMANPVAWDNYILEHAETNEQRYTMPVLAAFRVSVEERDEAGMQTFVLNHRNINDRAVIYLHGKNYMDQPTIYHWRFLDALARRTRAEVIVPLYPLAPQHRFEEAYSRVEGLYRETCAKYGASQVTLMGDSSGAGMAAGFCQTLPELGLEQPARLILISPWVDASLNNPEVLNYELDDGMFSIYGMRKAAREWAGETDINDPRLSPINGDVRMLRNVIVYTGTCEILHPDAVLFEKRISATGAHAELHIGRGLHNNYPLYPIPEAARAIDQIVQAVSTD